MNLVFRKSAFWKILSMMSIFFKLFIMTSKGLINLTVFFQMLIIFKNLKANYHKTCFKIKTKTCSAVIDEDRTSLLAFIKSCFLIIQHHPWCQFSFIHLVLWTFFIFLILKDMYFALGLLFLLTLRTIKINLFIQIYYNHR